MNKYLIGTCVYNEGEKIQHVIKKFNDYQSFDFLIIDDGSTDGSLNTIQQHDHLKIIKNEENKGAGFGVRCILKYGRDHCYEAVFFVSGNNKDDPKDIEKLKNAIEQGFDFVQGSRYLPGGQFGQMPLYRIVSTRLIHPLLFSLITGKRITDSTNGFRAMRLSILKDPQINLDQDWLNQYELEPYLFFKAITLGYKVKEVPVSKIYPHKKQGYTKMKPLTGWWSILRPLVYLGLRIKK